MTGVRRLNRANVVYWTAVAVVMAVFLAFCLHAVANLLAVGS